MTDSDTLALYAKRPKPAVEELQEIARSLDSIPIEEDRCGLAVDIETFLNTLPGDDFWRLVRRHRSMQRQGWNTGVLHKWSEGRR